MNDKLTDTRNAARPNSARATGTRSSGGTSLACDDLTGWPTASKVHFVTYKIDSNSNPVAGTQLDCSGIVSGNTIGSFTVIDGTDTGNQINDVVEMLPTAAWGQDLSSALTLEHDRTGAHTSAAVTTLKTAILGVIYPVGSIYTNASNASNPASLLGFGTWTAFGAGRVMVGVGTSDQAFTAGATGGESNHTLTVDEMAQHNHSKGPSLAGYTPGSGPYVVGTGNFTQQMNAGGGGTGGGSHNNLQPYIVVYMWQRTA